MNACSHLEGPLGYVQRMDWLEKMSKRYKQVKCGFCNLYVIWRKK